ncbi:MAG: hypothetical protein LBG48_02210 [Rickettsiales bacterium]|jgi:hypothetical protein|nr:hypothetical protein [Rickettsiales bacterium]
MRLVPSTQIDAVKFAEYGYDKVIFPIDELLDIEHFPLKMTMATMLETAYWVQSSSYELAAKQLYSAKNIKVNMETIRAIANTIGKLVFDNDVKEAENYDKLLDNAKLEFPSNKLLHILYLEIDSAILHTRERNDDGSSWRENKLGIVFSSKYFTYYTDKKTKERRPRVGTREYRAFL